MNNNAEEERSIQRHLPRLEAEWNRLIADPEIAAVHADCVQRHREKIAALKATKTYSAFYNELTSARMQKLSRLHQHFGAGVFLSGPEVIPDAIAEKLQGDDFFFTVKPQLTEH